VDDLAPVLDVDGLAAVRRAARLTHVDDAVLDYAVALVRRTRAHPRVAVGASARAAIVLTRCAQASAVLSGRDFVSPDDVKALTVPVLAHRIALADHGGGSSEEVVLEVRQHVPVPVPR
jgi:MoxR-like ATPase